MSDGNELKPLADSFKPLIASSPACSNLTSAQAAVQAAKTLFGCYRKDDAADPEVYLSAAAAVLSSFPPHIVKQVVDPRTGLAGESKWLPTISEIREACGKIASAERVSDRREFDAAAQLEERHRFEAKKAQPKPTIEDLKAKHGENWGLSKREDDLEARQRQREQIDRANKVLFERQAENQWASTHLADLIRRQMAQEAAE